MLFKKVIKKVRRAILCCKSDKRKPSLDIGSPTNVRHIPITDSLPGLTDSERLYIREKASSDAIHLLGLHTSPPSPTGSNSPLGSHSPSVMSTPASRENSLPLLNAASKDLPEALPTPPRRAHGESSPPRARMKGISTWDFVDEGYRDTVSHSPARRLSFSSAESASKPKVLRKIKLHDVRISRSDSGTQKASERRAKRDANESFMSLNFGFDWEDNDADATSTTPSLSEGFEMQDTIGGHAEPRDKAVQKGLKESAVRDSDSEADVEETRGLVKI